MNNTGSSDAAGTHVKRIAHYRQQAEQFRRWAEGEIRAEARDGLLDMAKQYERLARELATRSPRR